MKKIYYILLISIIGFFYSCDSFLDVVPDNIPTIDNAFSDKNNAEKYLFTCYSYLPEFSGNHTNPALFGDDIWYSAQHQYEGFLIAQGLQNVTSVINDYWSGQNSSTPLFTGIRDCNTFLDKIGGVRDLDAYQRVMWTAEVKFLKAYYHYYLLRMYGPIPIVDESTPVSAKTDVIKVTRQPVDSCFAYVVRLMDEAIADLPDQLATPLTSLGRITKPIAMSIKAEILVTAASPLFNGNTVLSDLKNKNGQVLFNHVFDSKKWDKAAVACKDAIDKCESLSMGLYQSTDYKQSYKMNDTTLLVATLRGSVTDPWNKELVWGSTKGDNNQLQRLCSPRWFSYVAAATSPQHSPTLKMAEEFYTEHGVPIDEDTTFHYAERYDLRTATPEEFRYVEPGQQTAGLNFNREPRFYSSISFDRGAWFGNGSTTLPKEIPFYIHNRKGEYSSIFEIYEYSPTGMFPKKLVNINSIVQNQNQFVSERYAFPIMRMADLYLLYAEALNETKNVPDESVYENIDKVRQRAGLNGVVESWNKYSTFPNKPSTKEGMREIIQRERCIELAFEGHRYWDLRRWMTAPKKMNNPVKGWNVTASNILDYYRVTTLYNQKFTVKDYFTPISEQEILKNPKLVQNIGW